MSIDLVVLDLDGTVLDPRREAPIRPRVREEVARVLSRGVGVTLATGRTHPYASVRAKELGITLPLVTGQGVTVVWPDGRVLRERLLPLEVARRVAALAGDTQLSLYLRTGEGDLITLSELRRDRSYYSHLLGESTQVVTDLEPLLARSEALVKLVLLTDAPDAVEDWTRRLGPEVLVSRTHPDLVEGVAAGVDKGTGLQVLLEHLGLRPDQVLVVGDAENDLPMFALAGTSVAMGHAPERVRQAATWVAPPFEADGAAVALARFIG